MSQPKPRATAAYIEIIERNRATGDTAADSVIEPNEIRINGTAVLCADRPIKVHELELGGKPGDLVLVTLTLFARRVTIAAEDDLASEPITTAEHIRHGLDYVRERYGKDGE